MAGGANGSARRGEARGTRLSSAISGEPAGQGLAQRADVFELDSATAADHLSGYPPGADGWNPAVRRSAGLVSGIGSTPHGVRMAHESLP